jgi:hypothetical protein
VPTGSSGEKRWARRKGAFAHTTRAVGSIHERHLDALSEMATNKEQLPDFRYRVSPLRVFFRD